MLPDAVRDHCQALVAVVQATGNLPSLVAAAFAGDELLWLGEVGEFSTLGGAPASAARQYRIGSVTKTVTAVAVMQLRDEGLIDLNDPIGQHLADAPYASQSIRSLLSHSSGMTAEPAGEWWERRAGGDWQDLVRDNAESVNVFSPGARCHYSNLGYGLLGELVARLRRMSWYDALRAYVLDPLDMVKTTYHPTEVCAQGTSRNPLTGVLEPEPAHDTGVMAPAGQLWSTVTDLARWGHFLVIGHPSVLAASTLREMATVQSGELETQHAGGYGLGLRLVWRSKGTVVGHTGSMPGFLAGLFVDHHSRVGAVILCNATTGAAVESLLVGIISAVEPTMGEPEAGSSTVANAVVTELEGDWYWGNTRLQLVPTGAGFEVRQGTSVRGFELTGPDTYRGLDGYFAGEPLTVLRRTDGTISHLTVVTFVWTRQPYGRLDRGAETPPRPV